MRLIHGDGDGEPEDGWQTAPQRFDSEIITLQLCKFGGHILELEQPCFVRGAGRHPDVDCRATFGQMPALLRLPVVALMELPEQLRRPVMWES